MKFEIVEYKFISSQYVYIDDNFTPNISGVIFDFS